MATISVSDLNIATSCAGTIMDNFIDGYLDSDYRDDEGNPNAAYTDILDGITAHILSAIQNAKASS